MQLNPDIIVNITQVGMNATPVNFGSLGNFIRTNCSAWDSRVFYYGILLVIVSLYLMNYKERKLYLDEKNLLMWNILLEFCIAISGFIGILFIYLGKF